jgi:cell division protein FtsW (lipid II flippase)
MNNGKTISKTWLEISLFVIAFLLALFIGRLVTESSEEGTKRWQNDLTNGSIRLNLSIEERLTAKWCSRNRDYFEEWFGDRTKTLCAFSKASLWSSIDRRTPPQTSAETTLKGWQLELAEREKLLRKQLTVQSASDISPTVLSELSAASNDIGGTNEQLSLERQAADDWLQKQEIYRERRQQWDSWYRSVMQPALQAPINESSAPLLLNSALSLDGIGNDFVAQLVRRHIAASQNEARANQLLAMVSQLPAVLFTHWCLTLALVLILRWHRPFSHKITAGLMLAFVAWGALFFLGCASNPLQSFHWVLAGCLVLGASWCWQTFFPDKQLPPQSLRTFSIWVMPAWWIFSALGWLMMLDQSLHFHPRNRFLALEQWNAWWLATWIIAIAALSSDRICKILLWTGARWFQPCKWHGLVLKILASVLVVVLMYLAHRMRVHQHITGEALKLGFIFSIATWCVWRMPPTSDLWHSGLRLQALKQAWPTLWIFSIAAAISFVTRDKGPLLVICMLMVVLYSSLVGWTTGLAMLGFGFLLIFLIGVDVDVVGSRLQAWRNPFTADHDDMARLIWFQSAAAEKMWGFGPGQVPWCGTVSMDQCRGLPLQLQSDYTFTAFIGWGGLAGSLLLFLAFNVFCFHLLAHGARSSQRSMNPLNLCNSKQRKLAMQSHLLFFTGSLLLLQTWITVSGNAGLLPLTGLTWPLLSFGKTSLWVSTLLISSGSFGDGNA